MLRVKRSSPSFWRTSNSSLLSRATDRRRVAVATLVVDEVVIPDMKHRHATEDNQQLCGVVPVMFTGSVSFVAQLVEVKFQ